MIEEEIDFTDAYILRKKAEELIGKKKLNLVVPEEDINYRKLHYKLQVQQTELELQNEALRQANETTEVALKKYTMLFDLAAMGYFLLEPDGTISELNFTAADMLRERRFSLIGSNFKFFVSDKSKSVFENLFKKMYTGKAKESCKITLGYNGNALCMVYMEGIVTEDEQQCLLSVVNISKLKHAV
jgi:PAS domain-containing protein